MYSVYSLSLVLAFVLASSSCVIYYIYAYKRTRVAAANREAQSVNHDQIVYLGGGTGRSQIKAAGCRRRSVGERERKGREEKTREREGKGRGKR